MICLSCLAGCGAAGNAGQETETSAAGVWLAFLLAGCGSSEKLAETAEIEGAEGVEAAETENAGAAETGAAKVDLENGGARRTGADGRQCGSGEVSALFELGCVRPRLGIRDGGQSA